MKFNEIKESIVAADEVKKAEKAEKAAKNIEAYLEYTCDLIEANMTLDIGKKSISVFISREEMTPDYWGKFEYNGLLFKTRLPQVLNEKLGEGVKLVFNSLSYGKEVDYVYFEFKVELDN